MNSERVNDILLSLRRLIDEGAPFLPPIREIAKTHRCGPSVVCTAFKALCAGGLISDGPGRRAQVLGNVEPTGNQDTSESIASGARTSAQAFFQKMKTQIQDGVYRSGTPLPKRLLFASELGIAERTVGTAYKLLEKHGYVHRQGKRWIVGQYEKVIVKQAGSGGAILIVQAEDTWWRGLDTARTKSFAYEFASEASHHGIDLVPCSVSNKAVSSAIRARGVSAICNYARVPASRYIGSLVVGPDERLDDASGLLMSLCRPGRPVVWFDQRGAIDVGCPSELLTICRFAGEHRVATALLGICRDSGHRHVGFAGYGYAPLSGADDRPPWQNLRSDALKREAASSRPVLRVTSFDEAIDRLMQTSKAELGKQLRRLWDNGPIRSRKAIECFRCCSGLLDVPRDSAQWNALAEMVLQWYGALCRKVEYPGALTFFLEYLVLLFDPTITAIIVCNDGAARTMHNKAVETGLRIPEDISMLSVDNALDFTVLPVDTLDNGAGGLGYAAFHTITRDIPVIRGRDGVIESKLVHVRRGSMTPPSTFPPSVTA